MRRTWERVFHVRFRGGTDVLVRCDGKPAQQDGLRGRLERYRCRLCLSRLL